MNEYKSNLIEIGEVTPFYADPEHPVYDLVTEKNTTIHKDAMEVDYKGKSVVSISTIEHVGHGDYGHAKEKDKAWKLYKKIRKDI